MPLLFFSEAYFHSRCFLLRDFEVNPVDEVLINTETYADLGSASAEFRRLCFHVDSYWEKIYCVNKLQKKKTRAHANGERVWWHRR